MTRLKQIPHVIFGLLLAASLAAAQQEVVPTPPAQTQAQQQTQPQEWTLADLEEIAVRNHPALAQAQARVESARGAWVQAGLLPNPSAGYSGQQLGSRGLAEQQGVIVEQQIVRGGKLFWAQQVASQEVAKAEQQWAAMDQRVRTDVRLAYYDLLVAQRRLVLTQELVDIGGRGVRTAESLLKGMVVSETDVLQARVEADSATLVHSQAKIRETTAWRQLVTVMGHPQLPHKPLAGDLQKLPGEVPFDAALERIITSSPELAAAHAEVDRARQAICQEQSRVTPDLFVQGIVQQDQAIRGTDGAIQVTMPLPLFDRNQGRIQSAYAELTFAQRAVDRLELSLRQKLAAVYERYAAARTQYSTYSSRILPNAEKQLQLVTTGFRAGEISYLTLLVSQRTYAQTNLAANDAVRDLWAASLEIDGLLLRGSLDEK